MNEGFAATASAALSKKAKAAAKKDIRRALKPATAPVKKGIHKARKWLDKATSKVPVLGKFASLPLDVADDLVGGILPEIKSTRKKWMKPEFVDKLPQSVTAAEMVVEKNPGPGKKHKSVKKRVHKVANKLRRKAKKVAAKAGLRRVRGPSMRRVKYRNKKTGRSQTGLKMKSSEYLWETTISNTAAEGDEVISGGLAINPHALLLAELAIEVKRWEMYRIRPKIQLEKISNGVVDCELFGYYDPDPTDRIPVAPVARLQVAETHGGKPGYISKGMTWVPNSQRMRATSLKWFYCDSGNSSGGQTGADQRMENQYRFRLLVKRPPAVYTTTTGASAVPLKINLRIMYEIDFRNRTIDQPESSTVVGGTVMSIQAAAGQHSATSYTGLGYSTSPGQYSVSSTLNNSISYYIYNDGSNDWLYRGISQGTKSHKYVMISEYAAASTLTGAPAVGALTNLAVLSTFRSVTGSNEHLSRCIYSVADVNLATSQAIAGTSAITGTSLTYSSGTRNFYSAWVVKLNNFTTVTTAAACSLQIAEFDEGESLARLNWHGPATIEFNAIREWREIDDHKRGTVEQHVKKYIERLSSKEDELKYWKSKAQGREFETRERKEYKLSLTPTPSDDEDDWLAYQQQKAAMHKSPGIIGMKPLKIVQDDEKSERGAPRPKAGSQK